MLGRLLLLFVLTPLIELWLLMLAGSRLGTTPTVALVLITGVVGAALSRWQGLRTWLSIQQQMQEGRLPADALLDGLMILVAGLLLITPGILTDLAGFSLLIPPVRQLLRGRLRRTFQVHSSIQVQAFGGPGRSADSPHRTPADDDVIDVEFERQESESSTEADAEAARLGDGSASN